MPVDPKHGTAGHNFEFRSEQQDWRKRERKEKGITTNSMTLKLLYDG